MTRSSRGNRIWLAVVPWLSLVGCQTLSPSLIPCPISSVEQATRIQQLVPIGMEREDAVAALKKAGVSGTYGTARTIFYCDTWDQTEKERWHINVELLFDEQGKVYGYRPNPQTVGVDVPGTAHATKPVKQVASAKSSEIVDPFAE